MSGAQRIDGPDQEQLRISLSGSSLQSDEGPINLATSALPSASAALRVNEEEEEEESVTNALKLPPSPPDAPAPVAGQLESKSSAHDLPDSTLPVDGAGNLQDGAAVHDYYSEPEQPEQENSDVPQEISEPPPDDGPPPEISEPADQHEATPPPTELEPIPDETPLERLQREQQEAIEALNFQLARDIQTRIDNHNTAGTFSIIGEKSAELRRALDRLAGAWRRNREHLIQKFHDLEVNERTRADTDFEELKNRHLTELADLKSKLFEEYKREMTKPIPKYEDLLGQARGNAGRADFERAEKNQEDAEQVLRDERDRREATFRKSYKSQLRILLTRQGGDVEGLAKRTRDAVGDLEKRRAKEINDDTLLFRRKLDREYRRAVDAVTNRARASPRKTVTGPLITDRKAVAELLNALEDTLKAALLRYGLAAKEDVARPRLLVPHTRIEGTMSLRMQSRISTREQTKTATPTKTEKKEPGTARSGPRSKRHE